MKKFTLFFVALFISMTVLAGVPEIIYLKSSKDLWNQAGAWFWVHFYGAKDVDLKMTAVEGEEDLFSVAVPEGSTGCNFVLASNTSKTLGDWDGKWDQTDGLTIPADGKNMYTVTGWGGADGSWSTYTPAVTPEPEPTTFTVYFENTENWSKVYAYCWQNSGDKNAEWPGVAMIPVEGHFGFYIYTTDQSHDNIIFNDGSGKQTIDLKVPTDSTNCYNYTAETWSVYTAPVEGEPIVAFTNLNPTAELGATIKPEVTAANIENPTYVYTVSYEGGEAIAVDAKVGYVLEKYGSYVFTVVATGDKAKTATATYVVKVNPIAVVAGVPGLCHGEEWSTTSVNNAMYLVDGVYTITYENLPAGDYEFKVVYEGVWYGKDVYDAENSTPGATGTDNIGFTLVQPTDITISYNAETEKIILKAKDLDEFGEFVVESYTLCGSKVIFGGDADFNTTLAANDMIENNGVWTKTYTDVQLEVGDYQYKVAANHAWNGAQYPSNGDMILTISEAGKYNLTFTYEPNKAEGEKLTCVVEKIETPVLGITATWSIAEGAELEAFENVTVTFAGIDSVGRVLGVEVTEVLSTTSAVKILYSVAEDGTATAIGILPATKNGLSVTYAVEEEKGYDLVEGKLLKNGNYRIVLHKGNLTFNPRRKDENGTNLPAVKNDVEFVLNFSIKNDYEESEPLVAVEKTFTATPENNATVAELKEIVITYPELEMIRVSEPLGIPNQLTWAFLNQTMILTDEETGNTSIAEQAYCPLMSSQTAPNAFTIFVNLTMNGGPESLTQEGTWSVSVPEGLVMFSETEVNKAFTLYYTVKAEDGPTVDVENTIISSILVQDGMIVADGEYQIYTITGQNVTGMNGNLERGVYVVKAGNAAVKVMVK